MQASERRQGQVWAHTQLCGPWRLTCSLVAIESQHRHSQIIRGQRQTTGKRSTVEEVSSKCMPIYLSLQGSRLASCTCAGAKAKLASSADCRVRLRPGRDCQVAFVKVETCGGKYSGEICRGSMTAILALVSSVMKPVGTLHRAGYRGPQLPGLCS